MEIVVGLVLLLCLTIAWIIAIVAAVFGFSGISARQRALLIVFTLVSLPSYIFFYQPRHLDQEIAKNNEMREQRDIDVTQKFREICSRPNTTHLYQSLEYRKPVNLLITTSYGQDFAEERALKVPKKNFSERSSLQFNLSEGCWVTHKFDKKCLPSNLGAVDQEVISDSCFYVNPTLTGRCERLLFRISQDGPRQQVEKSEASHLLVVRDYELVYSSTNTEFEPDIVRFKLDILDRTTRDLIAETYIHKRRWLSNDTSVRRTSYCQDIDVQVAEFLNKAFPPK